MANLSSYLFKSHRPTGTKGRDAAESAVTEPTTATSATGKEVRSQKSTRGSSPDKKEKKEKKKKKSSSSTRGPSPDAKERSISRGRSSSPEKKKKSSSSSTAAARSPSPEKKSKHKRSSTKTKETTSTAANAPVPTAVQSPPEAPNEQQKPSSSSLSTTPSPPNIHKLVNRERMKRQIPPLGRSKAMDRMAQRAVDAMAKRDDVTAGLKLTSCQRLAKSLNTSVVARNVEALQQQPPPPAGGGGGAMYDETESIKRLHKLTMEKGSTSRDKILNERFEATGMAIATSRKTGNVYLVQIFRGKLKRAAVV